MIKVSDTRPRSCKNKNKNPVEKKPELLKSYFNLFISLCSGIITLVTGCEILWKTGVNYINSLLYNVDFSFFKVDFNLYRFLLLTLIIFVIFVIFKSVYISIKYFFKCFKLKKKIDPPVYSLSLTIIILIGVFIIYYYFRATTVHILLSILVIGIFLTLFFEFCFKIINSDDEKEIQNFIDLKNEVWSFLCVFASLMVIEVALCWIITFHEFKTKTEYYIIYTETENVVEVVIEAYQDYFIVKEGIIDNNTLKIVYNSQKINNSNDFLAYKKTFDNIEFLFD